MDYKTITCYCGGKLVEANGHLSCTKAKPEPVNAYDEGMAYFDRLGKVYARDYEKSGKMVAHRNLLIALRENQALLINGGIYTAKELDSRIQMLQEEIDSSGSDGSASMEDVLHKWLNEPYEGSRPN